LGPSPEFLQNILQRNLARMKSYQEVIENICGFCRHRFGLAQGSGDDELDSFLTEFFRASDSALVEKGPRVGFCRGCRAPSGNQTVESFEGEVGHLHLAPFNPAEPVGPRVACALSQLVS
jgi:hypothetical protein